MTYVCCTALVKEMNVCEFTAPPRIERSSGVPSLGRRMVTRSLPDALIMPVMKSSCPMPLITMASRSASFLMSSGRGW